MTETELVKHNHKPNFGRKVDGCPRCDELKAGAAPREPNGRIQAVIRYRADDERRSEEIREHFASAHHRNGGCGPVCTFGDW